MYILKKFLFTYVYIITRHSDEVISFIEIFLTRCETIGMYNEN